jgi:hypothetical protein
MLKKVKVNFHFYSVWERLFYIEANLKTSFGPPAKKLKAGLYIDVDFSFENF